MRPWTSDDEGLKKVAEIAIKDVSRRSCVVKRQLSQNGVRALKPVVRLSITRGEPAFARFRCPQTFSRDSKH